MSRGAAPALEELLRRVAAHADRHGLLPPGATVLAMVSGGPDSMALLQILARLRRGPLAALAVDHGLRPEAAAEIALAARAAAGLGVPLHVRELRLERGPALQERARAARRAAAREVASAIGAVAIATGHTASDQAETVLFRLARGTGRAGAVGMAPACDGIVRPLLVATAGETRRLCAELGLATADDPSNRDPRHARSRVRHRLLPALREVHGGAERHLAAFADRLRDEAELLAPLVADGWSRCALREGLARAALDGEPPALARLLVRRLVEEAGLAADACSSAAIARVLALGPGDRVDLPGGGRAEVARGVLLVEGPPAPVPAPAVLPRSGRVRWADVVISAAAGPAGPPTPARVALLPGGELRVRGALPGDRLEMPGGWHLRVGRLLRDAGVPARRRPLSPVVERDGVPVWVAGHRASPTALARPGEAATILDVRPFAGDGD